jgi:hypothetical protein
MNSKISSPQLAFSWFSDQLPDSVSKRKQSRVQKLRWPPRIGRKIAFRTHFGIEMGVLRAIRQGLVWRDYVMKDGKIASEGEIVMRPSGPAEWRHPTLVTGSEVVLTIKRIKAAHDADPSLDLKQVAQVWSDICQLQTYLALRARWERECKELAFGLEISPSPLI